MKAAQLIIKLYKLGVKIQLSGEDLNIEAPEGILTDNLINEISRSKADIISFLKKQLSKKEQLTILNTEKREYYTLSSAQRRFYFLYQLDRNSTSYNIVSTLSLSNEFQKKKIENTLIELIQRHESFRTNFFYLNEEPTQVIHDKINFQFEEYFCTEKEYYKIYNKFIRPFDLSKDCLLRAAYVEMDGISKVLLIDMHHIISDSVSATILEKEFISIYKGEKLVPLSLQYKDYSELQKNIVQQKRMKSQEIYWLNKFEEEIPVLTLPTDYTRSAIQSFEGTSLNFIISGDEAEQIKSFAENRDITNYVLFLATYALFISKISGQQDIVIGTPVAGRQHHKFEKIVGVFINTLALRFKINLDIIISEFLDNLKMDTLEAFDNQEYQFDDLVDKITLNRDPSRNPMFDVLFNFLDQKYASNEFAENHDKISVKKITSKFDITLSVVENKNSFILDIEYSTKLFERETIERFVSYFKLILNQIIINLDKKIVDLEIITAEQRQQILYEFNSDSDDYPTFKTVTQLFKEQVEKNANRCALSFNGLNLNYKELDIASNRLANLLLERGVSEEDVIGFILDRGIEVVVSILGILKVGCTYLPIDVDYPDDRINYMLENSDYKYVLTLSRYSEKIKKLDNSVLIDSEEYTNSSPSDIVQRNKPNNLLYIIYTSGTTGRPKGVMVENKSVVNLLFNKKSKYDFNANDTWTMFHSHCFDFSVWEMYGSLLFGGRLIIIPKLLAVDSESFLKLIKDESVTILNQTPSAFYSLIDKELEKSGKDLKLRYVIFGGEALNPARLSEWIKKYPEVTLVNMFGITETTVHVTYKKITEKNINTGLSNIGKAIPGYSIYVFDKNRKLQPIGIAGELYVGGIGLARGYIKNSELTQDRFIENPFKSGERLYKTGDLARWLPNGDLEYLGRIDSQIQLRGFRVELREIETCLLGLEQIKECVVFADKNDLDELYLIAYFVLNESHLNSNSKEIKELLSKKLPSYMIPSFFVILDKFPLTSNGKVDRKALSFHKNLREEKLIEPSTKTQKKLVEIWKESLKLEEVSINDQFFNIGGDSIKAIRLVNAINKSFGVDLKIADLYLNESIEKLSYVISNQKSNSNEEIKIVEKRINELKTIILDSSEEKHLIEDIYPMSDIEIGMAYHSILDREGGAYHDQMVRQVKISNFNSQVFEKALYLLCDKHLILRATLHLDDFQEPVQIVHKKGVVDYQHKDLTALRSEEQEDYLLNELKDDKLKGFDIKKLPLWHVKSYSVGNDIIIVLFMCHHAILDGWSDSSLMTELNNVYLKLIDDSNYKPQIIQCSYKDHVIAQILEKQNEETKKYWIQELKDYNRLEFSKDLNIVEDRKKKYASIDADLVVTIAKLANDYRTNIKNVYFAAYIDIIRRFSYKTDFVVGIVSNTRPVCPDGDKLLGCFLNTIPINIIIQPDITIENYLKYIFNKLSNLVLYDKLPLAEIQKLVGEDSSDKNPFFDTLFNYVDFHIFDDIEETKTVNYLGVNSNVRINTLFDFSINNSVNGAVFMLLYANNIIPDTRADDICNCFIATLKRFASSPTEQLGKDKVFSEEEKSEILYSFNNTRTNSGYAYQVSKILNKVFRDYANKKALVVPVGVDDMHYKYGGGISKEEIIYDDYSYQYIDQKSNSLARFLEKKGVKKNSVAGILLEPSVEMIISIVASLKLGVGYMPISSEFPMDRISYMLNDSDAKVIITDGLFNSDIVFNGEVINVEDDNIFDDCNEPIENEVGEDDAAYIIYTSGTTGKPKGVIISQDNLANYANWFTEKMDITSDDKGILTSSFAFDLGYSSLFTSVLNGAELHLPSKDLYLSPTILVKYIDSNNISYLKLTPSHFNAIINSNELKSDNTKKLRLILLGGEPINTIDLKKLFSIKNKIVVINHYGPTEATIGCITKTIKSDLIDEYSLKPVIGNPIHNVKAFILDNEGNMLPKGVFGELCISGNGLSLGYLNKPELTHNKFTQIDQLGGRVYRTGDKAKWLYNGDIEFLGRVDNQVKIRGYRVELGEIESCLKKSSLVRDAIVIAKQSNNNDKYICAYIIKEKEITESNSLDCINKDIIVEYSSLPSIVDRKTVESAKEIFIESSDIALNFSDTSNKINGIVGIINSVFDNTYSLNHSERERYKRQILLDGWGEGSQEKLKATTVFVAGAGGGASPTLMQLALAGFGKIIICDFDDVELSNLNRQFMHDESRLGMNKALSAKETLQRVNPNIEVIPIVEKLTRENVSNLVGDSALIFDMFDGVQDKFILSECAVEKGIPHIISAMTDINAYSAIFYSPITPCFHCVFDRNKLNALVEGMKRSDESYKKNPLAVVSSSLFVSTGFAVSEALKIVLGLGAPAYNKFFYYNSKGTDRISEMPNYRSMTYSFSDFFREVSKEQGFDWDIGWRGKYLEELTIKKDINCPVCNSSIPKKEVVQINNCQNIIKVNSKNFTETKNENTCVSICFTDEIAISLSILAIIKAGKSFCILSHEESDNDLKNIIITSGTRLIITDSNNINRAEILKNFTNSNIQIVNIDNISTNDVEYKNHFKNHLNYYYKDDDAEIKSIFLDKLANWLYFEKPLDNKKDISILKRLYSSLINNERLVYRQNELKGIDISNLLNQELLNHLPEYMLPSIYIEINSIPLTPNGKVDIKALPEPLQILDEEIEKPHDEKEEIILKIWQEVLGREKISLTDNFFRIGGDSIKAIQISARLNKIGYKLDMGDLLRLATIKGVADVITKSTLVIDQGDVTGEVLLTPIQWDYFKDNFDLHYRNMSVMFYTPNNLKKEEILTVFNKIVQHHDMFRCTYTSANGVIVQNIDRVSKGVSLTIHDLKGESNAKDKITDLATKLHSNFDLAEAPLLKLGLFKLDDGDRLLISIHHLVMDGISWRILFEDISILFSQYRKNETLVLPLKTTSFKHWSEKLQEYAKSEELIKEREYWEKTDVNVITPIPLDFNGDNKIKNSNSISVEFDAEVTSNLLSGANKAFGTEVNDILLTALGLSIQRLYRFDKVLISLEGHGREYIGPNIDISRTIGWFTTLFPVTLNMEYPNDLRKFIIVNKDILHKIPVKGLGYGLLKMNNAKNNIVYELKPQISFNYLGQFDEDINLINELTIAKESIGITNSPEGLLDFDISFSGMVRNKKLQIALSYNKSKFNFERMEILLNQYKKELLNIVQFCLLKDSQEITSSDLDFKNLSVEELESIFD